MWLDDLDLGSRRFGLHKRKEKDKNVGHEITNQQSNVTFVEESRRQSMHFKQICGKINIHC